MFSFQNDNLSIKDEYMRNTDSQSGELSCVVYEYIKSIEGFLGGSGIKNLPANAEGLGSILGSGRFPGEGNGNPLQYSCLGSYGQRTLVGYSPWGCKRVRHNLATIQTTIH